MFYLIGSLVIVYHSWLKTVKMCSVVLILCYRLVQVILNLKGFVVTPLTLDQSQASTFLLQPLILYTHVGMTAV